MIEVGNKKKKKNQRHMELFYHIPMFSLLGGNHRLPLFHMSKHFIWINEIKNLLMSLVLDI